MHENWQIRKKVADWSNNWNYGKERKNTVLFIKSTTML
jgi:hypothetical protein